MRLLLPIIIIGLAGGVFFYLTDPVLTEIDGLRAEKARLEQTLANADKLEAVKQELLNQRNAFAPADLERLNKMLPDNVDNVRLIIDINNVARRENMALRNPQIKTGEGKSSDTVIAGSDKTQKGAVTLGFSVKGSYEGFQSFLERLVKGLRLVDIQSVSFAAAEGGLYDYNVEIQTYWLK